MRYVWDSQPGKALIRSSTSLQTMRGRYEYCLLQKQPGLFILGMAYKPATSWQQEIHCAFFDASFS
jgi:hypothetical protein